MRPPPTFQLFEVTANFQQLGVTDSQRVHVALTAGSGVHLTKSTDVAEAAPQFGLDAFDQSFRLYQFDHFRSRRLRSARAGMPTILRCFLNVLGLLSTCDATPEGVRQFHCRFDDEMDGIVRIQPFAWDHKRLADTVAPSHIHPIAITLSGYFNFQEVLPLANRKSVAGLRNSHGQLSTGTGPIQLVPVQSGSAGMVTG